MSGRRLLCGAAVMMTIAFAGCGGGSKGTTPDAHADRARWAHDVDQACARTRFRITSRGRPASGDGVVPLIADAIGDARDGVRAIGAVRRPVQADDDVRKFLAEVDDFDAPLAGLGVAVRESTADSVDTAISTVRTEIGVLRGKARDAGLRECGRIGDGEAGLSAIESLMANRSTALAYRRARTGIARLNRHPPQTRTQLVRYFDRLQRILRALDDRLYDLPLDGPASGASYAFSDAVDVALDLCAEVATHLELRPFTPTQAEQWARRIHRADTRMTRTYSRLRRALLRTAMPLVPIPPGGKPGGTESS